MPNRMTQLSEVEYAYIAGIIDGEGCFSIKKNMTTAPHIRVTVGNTHEGIIDWLKDMIGGAKWITTYAEGVNRKTAYYFEMGGKALRFHLPFICPFLKIKKEQGKLALEFVSTLEAPSGRRKLSEQTRETRLNIEKEIKKLNKRGILV